MVRTVTDCFTTKETINISIKVCTKGIGRKICTRPSLRFSNLHSCHVYRIEICSVAVHLQRKSKGNVSFFYNLSFFIEYRVFLSYTNAFIIKCFMSDLHEFCHFFAAFKICHSTSFRTERALNANSCTKLLLYKIMLCVLFNFIAFKNQHFVSKE